ncbi:MAG: hypothetical protein HONBIEJF_02372 [Fimbriimonadaceae bacterium]|nr:hypothetical protein [Fimbriimonadaceae bacterium]
MRFVLALLSLSSVARAAGPYDAHGIPASSPSFRGWATGVVQLSRGPQRIDDPFSPPATYGEASWALGAPGGTYDVVSLGDGGSVTLSFDGLIVDRPGPDFAVFENGFWSGVRVFAELAFVEVSADGLNFVRFPSVSLTQVAEQVPAFGTLEPTEIYNLAGKHGQLEGTPFDLKEAGLRSARYVRVVDAVGSLQSAFRRLDSRGMPINDPWTTPFSTGGFDLDAIGVIHSLRKGP